MTKFKWLKDDKYVKQRSFENLSHLRLSFLFSLGLLDLDLDLERFDEVSVILNSSSFESCVSHLLSFFLPFLFSSLLYSFLLGELERDLSLSYLSTKSWYDGIMMINSITSPVPSFCHRFFLDLFLHLSGLPQVAWVQQRLKTRSKWIQLQNETVQRFHSV